MELSYASGISSIPLKGETIGQNLRKIAALFPTKNALICPYQNYKATYSEFLTQAEDCAKALIAAGIQRGDRVGIWSANRYEWVIIQYATALAGAIMVNINPGYKEQGLLYALEQSEIKLLIASARFRKTDYLAILDAIKPDCTHLEQTIIIEHHWNDFIEKGKSVSIEELHKRENSLDYDDAINIQYTSGTTGLPKGATLSHHNILNNGFFIGERLKYTENDIVCLPVPFYHCFGMVLGNLAITTHGACIVISGEAFEAETVLQIVEQEKCTSLYGVPTMFIAELEVPNFDKYDFSSLRTGIMAGSPCPIDTMKKVQSLMNITEICVCYGMTETSPVSTQSSTNDPLELRVSTVGTVHPHVEIKIINPETGATVPRGERGEICTRGYSVMLRYWNNPEETNHIIDENRWLHTGDVAVMDEAGYVSIVGRIKDLIIRGGENISPKEIEDFLMTVPGVTDAQVIGVYSQRYGEEMMAWIKRAPQSSITGEDITAFCRGKIATFKIPKFWKFVDEFPMTVTGKIRKVDMREISEKELGLDILRKEQLLYTH